MFGCQPTDGVKWWSSGPHFFLIMSKHPLIVLIMLTLTRLFRCGLVGHNARFSIEKRHKEKNGTRGIMIGSRLDSTSSEWWKKAGIWPKIWVRERDFDRLIAYHQTFFNNLLFSFSSFMSHFLFQFSHLENVTQKSKIEKS